MDACVCVCDCINTIPPQTNYKSNNINNTPKKHFVSFCETLKSGNIYRKYFVIVAAAAVDCTKLLPVAVAACLIALYFVWLLFLFSFYKTSLDKTNNNSNNKKKTKKLFMLNIRRNIRNKFKLKEET